MVRNSPGRSPLLHVEPFAQALARWAGAFFAKCQVCGGSDDPLLFGHVLDTVQLENEVERLLSDRRRRESFVEVSTQMSVAGGALARRNIRDRVVAAVRVDEQRSLGAAQNVPR